MSKILKCLLCRFLEKLLESLEERQPLHWCNETNDECTTGNETSLPLNSLEIKLDMVQKEQPFTSV